MPPKKKKGAKKSKKKTTQKCCSWEQKYKEQSPEDKITELIHKGILQDLESVNPESISFDEFVGEIDIIGSQYDTMTTQIDPSLAQVRNFAIEYGVLPFGCKQVREKFPYPQGLLFYGPPGSGKTMLSRCIAANCGARWFDLSPSKVCDQGIVNTKKDLEMLIHLTFDVAKYLKPSVIYIDEIERLFEGSKQSIVNPSWMLDALKNHMKKKIDANTRILVIGNSSKIFKADDKQKKTLKSLFTNSTENKEIRYMCYCPYPDYYNSVLLWKKFVRDKLHTYKIDLTTLESFDLLDLAVLAKCSEGYTAGAIKQAIFQTLSYRRVQNFLQLGKPFSEEEFLNNLSQTEYTYNEDHQNFSNFTEEVTCRKEALKAIEDAAKKAEMGDEPKKDSKKKLKK